MRDKKTYNGFNREEASLVKAIDEKLIFDELMPAIRAVVKSGGGADAILRKSEPLAAVNLIKHASSEDEQVALKASIEILNRTQGRPVERSVNLYGDINRMNERDVDAQIMRLLETTGARPLVEAAVEVKAAPKRKQRRKPRKSNPLADTPDGTPQA
jgi:hypothetical protein